MKGESWWQEVSETMQEKKEKGKKNGEELEAEHQGGKRKREVGKRNVGDIWAD